MTTVAPFILNCADFVWTYIDTKSLTTSLNENKSIYFTNLCKQDIYLLEDFDKLFDGEVNHDLFKVLLGAFSDVKYYTPSFQPEINLQEWYSLNCDTTTDRSTIENEHHIFIFKLTNSKQTQINSTINCFKKEICAMFGFQSIYWKTLNKSFVGIVTRSPKRYFQQCHKSVLFNLKNQMMIVTNVRLTSSIATPPLMKPLNILIDCINKTKFTQWKSTLESIITNNSYVIYNIKTCDIVDKPWQDTCVLMILDSDVTYNKAGYDAFEIYISNGGTILLTRNLNFLLCEILKHNGNIKKDLHSDEDDVEYDAYKAAVLGRLKQNSSFKISDQNSDYATAVYKSNTGYVIDVSFDICNEKQFSYLKAILQQHSNIQCQDIISQKSSKSELSTSFLFGNKERQDVFLNSMEEKNGILFISSKEISFSLHRNNKKDIRKQTENHMSVIYDDDFNDSFDISIYQNILSTHHLGQLGIFTNVITSTHSWLKRPREGLSDIIVIGYGLFSGFLFLPPRFQTFDLESQDGMVFIAKQQTQGEGRYDNSWLSPLGCMMFSCQLNVTLKSKLGQSIPIIQHLVAVAMVKAIRNTEEYKDLDIGIKWPNDIYYRNSVKLGGILLNTTCMGGNINVIIGCGMNIANDRPTVSVNHIIKEYNHKMNKELPLLRIEDTLARTLNYIESLVDEFQHNGIEGFLEQYYKYWIHGGTSAKIGNANGEEVFISGLDRYGYLLVKHQDGRTSSLQPDGNSFDMMKNLLIMR